MSFLNKFESVMLKIFQIMDKLNKFSNQTTEPGLSLEHDRKKTKRKQLIECHEWLGQKQNMESY